MFSASASLDKIVPAQVRFARGASGRGSANLSVTTATGQAAGRIPALRYDAAREPQHDRSCTGKRLTRRDISVDAQVGAPEGRRPASDHHAGLGRRLRDALARTQRRRACTSRSSPRRRTNSRSSSSYDAFVPAAMYFNGMLYYAVDTIASGPLRSAIDDFYAAFQSGRSQTDAGQRSSLGSGLDRAHRSAQARTVGDGGAVCATTFATCTVSPAPAASTTSAAAMATAWTTRP